MSTETTRQRNARLRADIDQAHENLAAAIRAEREIDAAFACIQSQEDAQQFLAENDWNAAHDAATAAEADIKFAESAWSRKDIDTNTLALVDANID